MGLAKVVVVVVGGYVLLMNAPALVGMARESAAEVAPRPEVTSAVAAYDRMCPLLDAYFTVDATGQKALAVGIRELARQNASSTDPAVRAFNQTVPAALAGRGAARDVARAFLVRECKANG